MARKRTKSRWAKPSTKTTPNQLRKEGVLEIGNAGGVLFVLTRLKLHLINNLSNTEDRKLDDYAIELAVNWIEGGHRSYEVARYLDVSPQHLQKSLQAAGYERLEPTDQERHWKAGMTQKLGKAGMTQKLGNRKGKLVNTTAIGSRAALTARVPITEYVR